MTPSLRLAVCGLHLRGYPLHSQLTDLKARFVRACNSVSTLMCFGSLTTLPSVLATHAIEILQEVTP